MKQLRNNLLFSSMMAMALLLFSACQKNAVDTTADMATNTAKNMTADAFIMKNYPDVAFQTKWQLQQASAAANYMNINNALITIRI